MKWLLGLLIFLNLGCCTVEVRVSHTYKDEMNPVETSVSLKKVFKEE